MLIGTIDLFTVGKFYQIQVQETCFAFFSLTCPLRLLNLRTGYGLTGWSMVIHKNSYYVTLGIVDISENFNCFSSVSVLYRIRFICSLIALPYWLVWLLQLFHGGKKMKHFLMGIVFLISIFTVFLCVLYVFAPFVPFTVYLVTLCVWFSNLLQHIENIPFIPIPNISLTHFHDSRYIQKCALVRMCGMWKFRYRYTGKIYC